MNKLLNIISITLLLSVIGVYMYVYAVPWFKGTMVISDDPNCLGSSKKCEGGAYCCRDPRQGSAFCLSVPCDEVRLEQPKDNQVTFFKIYSICVIGIIILFAVAMAVSTAVA